MAPPTIIDSFHPSSTPSRAPTLLSNLEAHLPHSLPLLRRLQFASRVPGGSTEHSHVVYVYSPAPSTESSSPFAAAYLDLSRGPETECWIFSTLQSSVPFNADPTSSAYLPPFSLPAEDLSLAVAQVLHLLGRIRGLEARYSGDEGKGEEGLNKGHSRGFVRVGALHETVRRLLVGEGVRVLKTGVVGEGREWEFYCTWLVRVGDLKQGGEVSLPEGCGWDVLRERDTALVKGRTNIPKRDDTMLMVPSTVIRREDGTAIAWVYLGVDGSVSTLHVEEPYRGRGLAKALTGRLLRTRLQELGDDGWCSTDISTTNLQSQGVFRSIGGKPAWTVSWMYLDLSTVGDRQ